MVEDDFTTVSSAWVLRDSAFHDGAAIGLTGGSGDHGELWFSDEIPSETFTAAFRFRIVVNYEWPGGAIAFDWLPGDTTPDLVRDATPVPGASVFIDLYKNADEPDVPYLTILDEVAFAEDYPTRRLATTSISAIDVSDGTWHRVEIRKTGSTVVVVLDEIALLNSSVQLATAGDVRWGVHASTGVSDTRFFVDDVRLETPCP